MIAKSLTTGKHPTFGSLARYIAAANEKDEKLEHLWAVNCQTGDGIEDLDLLIVETEATQSLNWKSRANKNYHLVVSFKDEKPSLGTIKEIENRFANILGFEEHQRICGIHTNTENYHLHIGFNKIHPVSYRLQSPYYAFSYLERECRAIESEYGFKQHEGYLCWRGLPRKSDRAMTFEAKTWEQSFGGYVLENRPRLEVFRSVAETWQDLHEDFLEFGLLIEPRGKGCTFVDIGRPNLAVRASSLGRDFGMRSLALKLGPFEEARQIERSRVVRQFEPRPITKHRDQSTLWKSYREAKATNNGAANWREFLENEAKNDQLAREIVNEHRRQIREGKLNLRRSRPI